MRKCNSSAGSAARTEFGVELAEGLKAFPETAPLAAELEDVNGRLDTACDARHAKAKSLARARAGLTHSESLAEQGLRMFARAVEMADGGRYGPLYHTLFPEGLVGATRPSRAQQVRVIGRLVEELERTLLPGVEPVRTEWLPRLTQRRDDLQAAVTAYDTAFSEHQSAYREEYRLRLEHDRVVDRIVGQVRAAFPKDRARQNAVFPARPSRSDAPVEEPLEPPPAAS